MGFINILLNFEAELKQNCVFCVGCLFNFTASLKSILSLYKVFISNENELEPFIENGFATSTVDGQNEHIHWVSRILRTTCYAALQYQCVVEPPLALVTVDILLGVYSKSCWRHRGRILLNDDKMIALNYLRLDGRVSELLSTSFHVVSQMLILNWRTEREGSSKWNWHSSSSN